MTTIAYHHDSKAIAVDSRRTMGAVIVSDNTNKIKTVGDDKFILCGTTSDFEHFMSLNNGEKNKRDLALDVSGIKVSGQPPFCDVYYVYMDNDVMSQVKLDYNCAFGSGLEFATAAMDFGKSAKEAVEYAITRDIYSGGEVREIEL